MAAMRDVDVVYHLAGTERYGSQADLNGVDIDGTAILAEAAVQAGVERFFYLSHIGADRASAFPVMKAKGIAEGLIKKSGITYTIFKSSAVFGPGDQFTTVIDNILRSSPFFFLIPGDGLVNLQPLWIEDLVTSLTWALEEPKTRNQTIPIGGCEYLTYRQIVEIILAATRRKRTLINSSPVFLRSITLFSEQVLKRSPVSVYWLDYLAVDHTTALDTLPRLFGLMPARLSLMIDYLRK
jgi:NADH dehydrogenase